jgi:hypothetical protein
LKKTLDSVIYSATDSVIYENYEHTIKVEYNLKFEDDSFKEYECKGKKYFFGNVKGKISQLLSEITDTLIDNPFKKISFKKIDIKIFKYDKKPFHITNVRFNVKNNSTEFFFEGREFQKGKKILYFEVPFGKKNVKRKNVTKIKISKLKLENPYDFENFTDYLKKINVLDNDISITFTDENGFEANYYFDSEYVIDGDVENEFNI